MRIESFVDVFEAHGNGDINDDKLQDLLDRIEGKTSEVEISLENRTEHVDDVKAEAACQNLNPCSERPEEKEEKVIPDSEGEEEVIPDSQEEANDVQQQDPPPPPPFSCTMVVTPDLDTAFPPMKQERFSPSPFQVALLQHVDKVRAHLCHQVGLLVMATALGKTIFCILDIERQLRKSEAELEEERREREQDVSVRSLQQGTKSGKEEEGTARDRKEGEGQSSRGWRLVPATDSQIEVKQEHLDLILPLGFPEASCRRALQVRDHDPYAAIDWLLALQEGKVWEELEESRGGEQKGKRGACGHFLQEGRGAGRAATFPDSKRLKEGGSRLIDVRGRRPACLNRHFTFLFLVHTRAIRDAAYEKFQRHFVSLGYERCTDYGCLPSP
eukprot:749183-Hanusia_phi.AAC.1